MPNKYHDIRQQLLWEHLVEQVNKYGNRIVQQVCKDFLAQGRKERVPKIQREDLSALEKQADSVFSKWIIKRDKQCVTCGSRKELTNSHLFKRGRQAIRFNENNCNCQCQRCNSTHNDQSEIYTKWWLLTHSQELYEELITASKQLKS